MNWQRFESYVADVMQAERIPGLAVSLTQDGRTVYEQGFGRVDLDSGRPVTPETIFGIASVTKSFTAMAIMQLAEAGQLAPDDPVLKYLPQFTMPAPTEPGSITISHLLSHSTGMPPMPRRQDLTTFPEHLAFLADVDYRPLGQPGRYFSYCNDAFLLLGAIIEKVSGIAFRDYIVTRILEPLDMTRSVLDIEKLAELSDVSTPYVHDRVSDSLVPQPWPPLGNYEVGGGVRSSVRDLQKYARAYLDPGLGLLGGASVTAMITPRVASTPTASYGYALRITGDHFGVRLVEHGGSQPGVSANFGFLPEKGMAAAVLCNLTGASAARIWLALVNCALGLDPLAGQDPYVSATWDTRLRRLLPGRYASLEGANIVIADMGSSILITQDGLTHELYYAGNGVCYFDYRGQKPVKTFVEDDRVWAILAGSRMVLRQEGKDEHS